MTAEAEVAEAIRKTAPPSDKLDKVGSIDGAKYLKDFGYLDGLKTLAELPSRVKQAQGVLRVEQDGWVGDETHKAMTTQPRCGLKDYYRLGGAVNQWLRQKATTGKGLTYHFIRYVNYLSPADQEDNAVRWLTLWEKVCGVRFHRLKSTSADIIIDASSARNEEFGTVGNVLAWAYLPQGVSHRAQLLVKFDLAETWTKELHHDTGGHEFGHLLGMDHTQTAKEWMFPMLQKDVHSPQAKYDIPQVVHRYGTPAAIPTPTPTPPPVPGGVKIEGTIKLNGLAYSLKRV